MELRQGITGFRHVDDPDLPVCDLSAFRAHCHAAARLVGGRVTRNARRPVGVEANFALTVLEVSGVQIAVLLNCHFPVVGFAVPPAEGENVPLQFRDQDSLAEVFKASGVYEVKTRAELECPVGERDFGSLAQAEIWQVNYWRPARVGDVVFNFWD